MLYYKHLYFNMKNIISYICSLKETLWVNKIPAGPVEHLFKKIVKEIKFVVQKCPLSQNMDLYNLYCHIWNKYFESDRCLELSIFVIRIRGEEAIRCSAVFPTMVIRYEKILCHCEASSDRHIWQYASTFFIYVQTLHGHKSVFAVCPLLRLLVMEFPITGNRIFNYFVIEIFSIFLLLSIIQ